MAEATSNGMELEKPATEQSKGSESKAASKKEVTALSISKPEEKSGQIQISGSIFDRPVASSGLEIYESYSEAGNRPIMASHLKLYGTILNNRPIMASDVHVLDVTIPGQRPVFASDIVVSDDYTLPGGRPIIASDPRLLDAPLLPGGRPIASNEIDNESETLMGYID